MRLGTRSASEHGTSRPRRRRPRRSAAARPPCGPARPARARAIASATRCSASAVTASICTAAASGSPNVRNSATTAPSVAVDVSTWAATRSAYSPARARAMLTGRSRSSGTAPPGGHRSSGAAGPPGRWGPRSTPAAGPRPSSAGAAGRSHPGNRQVRLGATDSLIPLPYRSTLYIKRNRVEDVTEDIASAAPR